VIACRHDTRVKENCSAGGTSRFRNRGNGWDRWSGASLHTTRCRRTIGAWWCSESVLLQLWKRALMRRSQRARRTWKQMPRLIDDCCQDHAFCILGLSGASTLSTRGGSRVPKSGSHGSMRGRAVMRVPTRKLHELQIDRTSCSDFLGQPVPRAADRCCLRVCCRSCVCGPQAPIVRGLRSGRCENGC